MAVTGAVSIVEIDAAGTIDSHPNNDGFCKSNLRGTYVHLSKDVNTTIVNAISFAIVGP